MANKILETLKYVEDCRKEGISNFNSSSDPNFKLSKDASLREVVGHCRGDYKDMNYEYYKRPNDFPDIFGLINNIQNEVVDGVTYVPCVILVVDCENRSITSPQYYQGYSDAYKIYGDSSITIIQNPTSTSTNVTFEFSQRHMFDTDEGDYSYIIFYKKESNLSTKSSWLSSGNQLSSLVVEAYFINGSLGYETFAFSSSDAGIYYHLEYLYVAKKVSWDMSDCGSIFPSYFFYNIRTLQECIILSDDFMKNIPESQISRVKIFCYCYSLKHIKISSPYFIFNQYNNNRYFPSSTCLDASSSNPSSIELFEYNDNLKFPFPSTIGAAAQSTLKSVRFVGPAGTIITNASIGYAVTEISFSSNVVGIVLYCTTAYSLKVLKIPEHITERLEIRNISATDEIELYDNFDIDNTFISLDSYQRYAGLNLKTIDGITGWLKDHSADGQTRTITLGSVNIAKFTEEQLAEIARKGWTLA